MTEVNDEGNGVRAFGGPEVLAVREVPDPAPPGAGEIQVRIEARGVQYVDVLMLAGKYQFRPEPPFIPGGEAAGHVVAVGPDVTRFAVGDRGDEPAHAGRLRGTGQREGGAVRPGAGGHEHGAQAGVFRGAYTTAYHALLQRGRMKAGEWVLVHGAAGGIGIAAIQMAKAVRREGDRHGQHARKSARRAWRKGRITRSATRGGFLDQVKELTGGRGVDIVYDPIGAEVAEESLRCLAWCGRLLILGFLGGGPTEHPQQLPADQGHRRDRRAHRRPERGRSGAGDRQHAGAGGLAGQGKLRPRISHRFPLEQAAEALQAVIDRKVIGKAVLVG